MLHRSSGEPILRSSLLLIRSRSSAWRNSAIPRPPKQKSGDGLGLGLSAARVDNLLARESNNGFGRPSSKKSPLEGVSREVVYRGHLHDKQDIPF